MKDFIMVFNNTHEAMEGERIFKNNNIKFMIIPTPTYITQSCGISVRFTEAEAIKVEELYDKDEIKFKNVYEKTHDGFIIYK